MGVMDIVPHKINNGLSSEGNEESLSSEKDQMITC